MPTTYAIPNGRTVFDATTYTGTGSSYAVTNATGFKPDFVWIKERSQVQDHALFDSVRGATKQLSSNTTGAEATYANSMSAFNTNGFSVVSDAVVNSSGQTYVGWQWQAGQGTTSSNTNGSITSTVSVNATAGFSVVKYTMSSGGTMGHGLGVAPKFMIRKVYSRVENWGVYHESLGATQVIYLNSTNGAATQTLWGNTAPTSTVFTVGSGWQDPNDNCITYCWAEIAGFSKFGSYTGNGSTDGPFVYLGFRPKFVMLKISSTTGNWYTLDTSINPYNESKNSLNPNTNSTETTDTNFLDILSNGFKLRTSGGAVNGSGATIIYAAFAENPFKYANAR